MIWKCGDCGDYTSELNVVQTRRQTHLSPSEYDQVCERCGSSDVAEAAHCNRCGEVEFLEDLDSDGECQECRNRPERAEVAREARAVVTGCEGWD